VRTKTLVYLIYLKAYDPSKTLLFMHTKSAIIQEPPEKILEVYLTRNHLAVSESFQLGSSTCF